MTALGSVPASSFGDTTATGAAALSGLLAQLAGVLASMEPAIYTARPAATVSGSVGEHVRHLLDHVTALVEATPGHALSYDQRERGTIVEREPGAALQQIGRLQDTLRRWQAGCLTPVPMEVVTRLNTIGDSVIGWSTSARELAFVISHTIHHQAIIAVLLASQGVAVPHRFGVAPSTPSRD